MKIVTKSNYNEELYQEKVVAENVNVHTGKLLVNAYNERYVNENDSSYLELVEDDYKLYDGYKEVYGE